MEKIYSDLEVIGFIGRTLFIVSILGGIALWFVVGMPW